MSSAIIGSGKFVSAVSFSADSAEMPPDKEVDSVKRVSRILYPFRNDGEEVPEDTSGGEASEDTSGEGEPYIPPSPENPDTRPKLILLAEEYFGKCWLVVLLVFIVLVYMNIKK